MAEVNKKQSWKDTLESIKVSVSPAIFSTWFNQTHLVDLKRSGERYIAEVGCASAFVKTTIESRYWGLVQDSMAKVLGGPVDLIFDRNGYLFISDDKSGLIYILSKR